MGWRTAETPSRTGTFSTQSDRLDGTLGGTVSASLKGERPGWLSPCPPRLLAMDHPGVGPLRPSPGAGNVTARPQVCKFIHPGAPADSRL